MSHSGIVLLVDDDPNLRSCASRVLRNEGFELLLAGGAREAFELLERCDVDVVVSDHKMPRMQGTEFLAEVRRRWPGTVRMMLTGETDQEIAKQAINEGEIYRFFSKPIAGADLAFGIRAALDLARLRRESMAVLRCLRAQTDRLEALEREHPGITRLEQDEGRIVLKPDEVPEDLEALMAELRAEAERVRGE